MCKDHDQLHYPREIREACMLAACGDAVDRDLLLAALVHDGLVAFLEVEGECMPTIDLEDALRLLKRHWRTNARAIVDLKMRLHEKWDDRLDDLIAADEANQVD